MLIGKMARRTRLMATALLCAAGFTALGVTALPDSNASDIYLDRGAAGLSRCLAQLKTRASILMVTAHPDDEDGGLLAMQSRGVGARASLLTLTRGEGGQNAMSNDMYDALGLVRTQELLQAGRYYGAHQYWGREIDYGFSKTREEALEKWGYDRTLSDVVRVIRMTRPLVITSVFIGAPTDGHGNHQVAGQMAQDAFVAAGDPNRFPEQIREGLRPWSPVKVYERVPFFTPTKKNTIYDYATDKYVPLRFFDYVNKTWMESKPSTDLTVSEGTRNPASGLTFQQIGREGWGFQKSQNGGGTLPPPSLVSIEYHRYGSHIPVAGKEETLYDGIDVSVQGIAALVAHAPTFLTSGLTQLSTIIDTATAHYHAEDPATLAPNLAAGLKHVRALRKRVENSDIAEPGRSDVAFELQQKETQFECALTKALGLTFDANVAPEKPATGPFAAFAGIQPTLVNVVPGQTLFVETRLLNSSPHTLNLENTVLDGTDGKAWPVKPQKSPEPSIAAGKEMRLRFQVQVPNDAPLTRAYFTRPNQEQPYYDVHDDRYRNFSLPPYPLEATAHVVYDGADVEMRRVVQTASRVEGIGIVQSPLYVAPALSVSVSPAAGALPLDAKSFNFSCALRSNIKNANGKMRLELPAGWHAEPSEVSFNIPREGEAETVSFVVSPGTVQTKEYRLKAIATMGGKQYEEGYQLVGYTGLRPYPYYRPATYKVSAVDVKVAPNLKVGFVPGTGDDLPRALADLRVPVRILSGADIESSDLSSLDAIVVGVRAYTTRPDLRAANNRLLSYVKNGGVLVVQYNLQNFDENYTPYPITLGSNPEKVVDEFSKINFLDPKSRVLSWPNRITANDFAGWEEERGHGFPQKWDKQFEAPIETHDPGQSPQAGGFLVAHYGKGIYVYDAYALYRQLPAGVPGAYRILANLVSLGKPVQNPVPGATPSESK